MPSQGRAPRSRLAVVVVTYNSGDVVDRCIDALDTSVAQTADSLLLPYTLVVVDNASRVKPRVREDASRQTVRIALDDNVGFARGVNRGLTAATSADVVLLLNPDAVLAPSALSALVAAMHDGNPALAGALLTNEEGIPRGQSERPFHSLRREAARQLAPTLTREPPYGPDAYRTGLARCLTGACLLVDNHFLGAVGGLDEAVPMYLEDVELCWQAHEAGRSVRFVSDALCTHGLGGSSEDENFRTSQLLYFTLLAARVEFVSRRRGPPARHAMRALMAAGAAGRGVVLAVRRHPKARLHWSAMRWAVLSGRTPHWPPARR